MSRRELRAVLFDLDDTILDDSSSVDIGWRTVCREAASRSPELDADGLLAAISEVRSWFWSDPDRHRSGRADLRAATTSIVAEALRTLGRDDFALASEVAHRYRDLRDEAIAPFPGAIDLLQMLRASGTGLALLTNGAAAAQRQKIDRFDLARHFDYICIEGEFGVGKPDERVYRAALAALAVAPESTWMVGDNLEWDVAAPMRLGVDGIWVDREGRGLPPGADVLPSRIVRSIDELLTAL